jgi:hypothetical protein
MKCRKTGGEIFTGLGNTGDKKEMAKEIFT